MVVLINLPVPLKRDVTRPLSVTLSRLNFPPACVTACSLRQVHGYQYLNLCRCLMRTVSVAGVLDDRGPLPSIPGWRRACSL